MYRCGWAVGLLDGKVAVITGGSRGIGRATALVFSKEGADVVVASRSLRACRAVTSEARRRFGTDPLAAKVDVSSTEDAKKLFKRTLEKYGRFDVLVNNAGYPFIADLWNKPFHKTADDEFRMVAEVDVMGAVRCIREALPSMLKQRKGVIINIASTPALAGYDKGVAYTIAKAAIIGLTKHLAFAYGARGVRVNAVALGNIRTAGTYDGVTAEERRRLREESPLRRWGAPEEAAGVIALLASDYGSFVTGQIVVVDGGTVMY